MCKCIMICIKVVEHFMTMTWWALANPCSGVSAREPARVWLSFPDKLTLCHSGIFTIFAILTSSSSMMNMKSFQFAIPASSSAMMSLKHWQFTFRQLLFSISCHEDLYSSNSPLSIFVIVLKYPRVVQELSDKPFGCLLCKERRKEFKKFRENCVLWTSWSV